MKIGFIGLGMMGSGMAANLQRAGHDLVVHDLRRAAAEPFLAAGAVWADSPRAVAHRTALFRRIVPIIKGIGLWSDAVRDGLAAMGLLHDDDVDVHALLEDDARFAAELDRAR